MSPPLATCRTCVRAYVLRWQSARQRTCPWAQVALNARPLRAFRPLVRDDRRYIRCARCMVSFINSPIAATRTRAARRRSHYHVPPLLLERCRQVRMRPWRELVSHRTASNPLADSSVMALWTLCRRQTPLALRSCLAICQITNKARGAEYDYLDLSTRCALRSRAGAETRVRGPFPP